MGLDRRSFLMFVLGGAAGWMLTPMMWKPIDDISIWTQNWPWVPKLPDGALGQKAAVVKLGGPEYGVKIQTVGGKPCQVYGDEDHPLSRGGLEPLGAASVRLLASPSRVTGPMKKNGNGFEPLSWKEADKMLADRLGAANGSVACISGDETSSINEVFSAFLSGLGSSDMYLFPGDASTQALVWQEWMGGRGQVGYDLERADHVLILGADMLGGWGSVVKNSKAFAANPGADYIYAGPAANSTSVVCGKWVAVDQDALGHLALSMAYHLLRAGNMPFGVGGLDRYEQFVLSEYTPEKAEQKTGLPVGTIRELARGLSGASRPVVVTGSVAGQGASPFDLMAGMSLNILLNRINKPGGVTAVPEAPAVVSGATAVSSLRTKSLVDYLDRISQGQTRAPEVLLVYEANPYFSLPGAAKAAAALDKVPFKVSFSSFMDETAASCDLILPNAHFLERADDSYSPFGASMAVYSVNTPVAEQALDTRPTGDVILGLARAMGMDLGARKFDAVIEAKAKALGGNVRNLKRGNAWTSNTQVFQADLTIWNGAMEDMAGMKDNGGYPLSLVATSPTRTGSRMMATPPGGLLAVSETEIQGGDMFVRMNSATAETIGVGKGDKVTVASPSGEIQATVDVFEGVMTGAVLVPLGFGHTAWDEYIRGKGANASQLLTPKKEAGVFQWTGTRVKVEKI